MFGYPSSEALGKSMLMLLPPERSNEEPGILESIRRGDSVDHFETVRVRKDGERIDISATISPIRDTNGAIVGASKIARDITDRKQAEEDLREKASILDWAQVLVRDLDARIVMWNRGAEKLYGYSKEEAVGKLSHELLQSKFPLPLEQIEQQLRQNDRWEGELIHRRKDGGTVVVSSVWVLHRDAKGLPSRILEANTDITEQKSAERELQKLNQDLEGRVIARTAQLEAAKNELEAFTYSVSHDLRAPLRHIAGFCGILMEDCAPQLDADARHHLTRIQEGTRRMGVLVDELLALARVGRQALTYQPTRLNTLVDDVVALLKPDIEGRPVEWKIAELPPINCDPTLIRQVFQNLISNALKYSRNRTPAVIEIGHREENGQTTIFVRDNGAGFSMKYADKLFGVFQRLHRAEEFEGTGVGLATVQRIVQKHGGRAWAESEVDKGATFYFTLGAAVMKTVGQGAGG
jgi:PAS domain S-box-containing protein